MIRVRTPILILAGVAICVLACVDGGTDPSVEPPNRAPLPVGAIPRQTLHVGETATLDVAIFFVDPDGDSLTYTVATSAPEMATATVNGSLITLTAVTPGSAIITVTATDPGGLSAAHSFDVTVPNRAPLAVDSIPPLDLFTGDTATLDVASYFTDPDGDSLSYAAATSDSGTATATVNTSLITLTAVTQGSVIITVTATDPGGLSATHGFDVTVPNRAPLAVDSIPPIDLFTGDTATLDVASYFTDPDGDSLSYGAVTSDSGTATANANTSLITLTAVTPGSATVTVTATDPGGLSAAHSFDVTVPNRAPLAADSIPPLDLFTGDTATLDVASYFTDPDGDSLSYGAVTSDSGTATANANTSLITLTAVTPGSATVTVTATDPGGLSAAHSFDVTVPNRAPLAADSIPPLDLFTGDTASLEVASYFTDPDGDSLSYAAATSDPGTATATVKGSLISLTAITQGSAIITVTATDPGGLSAAHSFDVTVPNRAPVAVDSLPGLDLFTGDTTTLDVAAYFTDPDGDSLSYAAATSDQGTAAATAKASRITLAAITQGSATITVTAKDPGGLSAAHSFDVTVPNRAPVAVDSLPGLDLLTGDTATLDVASYFTDPDGDALSYTAESSRGETVTVDVDGSQVAVTAVDKGSATVTVTATDPGGLSATHGFAVVVELPPLSVSFATDGATAPEGGAAVLTVVLSRPPETSLTVGYAFGADDDPATDDADGMDYVNGADRTLDFGSGTTTATLRVVINDDADIEPVRETLLVALEAPGAEAEYLLGSPAMATVTIEEGVCDRTAEVQEEIMRQVAASTCTAVDSEQLTEIRRLPLCFRPGYRSCALERPLTALQPGDFLGLTSVNTLDLVYNHLSDLPGGAFWGLPELRNLSLGGNRVRSLATDLFAGLPKLERLGLDGNQLAELPPQIFSGLSGLKSLRLGDNRLDSLASDVFAGLSQLELLGLQRNRLSELPPGIFAGLSALRHVHLTGNPGVPFTFTFELRRTDHEDLLAPSPGTVGVWIAEGAPFEMRVALEALGGTLSADTVLLEPGRIMSTEAVVTQATQDHAGTWLSATAPTINRTDIKLAAADPIVLFSPAAPFVALATDATSSPEGATAVIEVILNPPPTSPITLSYDLGIDDDPTTDDADESDFAGAVHDSFTVAAGTASIPIEIAITDDNEIEAPRETLILSLNAPDSVSGYVLGYPKRAAVTIREGVCDRTPQVRDALVSETGTSDCTEVDFIDLESIGSITIRTAPAQAQRMPDIAVDGRPRQHGSTAAVPIRCADGVFLVHEDRESPTPELAECPPEVTTTFSHAETGGFFHSKPLTALRQRDFWGLSRAWRLDLRHNFLKELPSGMLEDLPYLSVLKLFNNRLHGLPWQDLVHTPRLWSLELSRNEFGELPSELSEYAPNLQVLTLQNNLLRELPEDALAGLSKLKRLLLGFNPLEILPPRVFSGLASLSFLDLQDLNATELPPDVLSPLSSLETLWLTRSPLRALPDLSRLSSLRTAHLFEHPHVAESPSFAGASSLLYLDLGANPRLRLSGDEFAGLERLRLLALYGLGMTALPVRLFSGLSNLETLNLRTTALSTLRTGQFGELARLKTLLLRDSRIEELATGVFGGLDSLETVTLHRNRLTELPRGLFNGIGTLRALLLHENPGAPFVLPLEAVRTDSDDLLAPGPARMEVGLGEGAPFDIRIPLAVHGGNISTNTVELEAGSDRSAEVTVTQAAGSQGATQVVVGPTRRVPRNFTGLELSPLDPLVLFAETANRAPVPLREIPWLRLRAGGDPVSIPIAAHFRDPDGDELEFTARSDNAAIAFAVLSDNRVEVTPNAIGVATVTVTATDPGALSAVLSFTVIVRGRYPSGSFDIDLILNDDVSESMAGAFDDAIAYWEALLGPTELTDVPVGTGFELGCNGIVTNERVETVDELVIVASVNDIDGPGGILAAAAVCAVREESGLPFMGAMNFDLADLESLAESGDMEEVILHEIGHTLGFGTIWSEHGLLVNPSLPSSQGADTYFPGPYAVEAFDSAGGTEYTGGEKVPVENRAGPGSGDSHWREGVLENELMTPYLDIGILDLLSAITIQSLADLGYTVDAAIAEPFTLPGTTGADILEQRPKIAYGEDVLRGPIMVVDRNGRIVRVVPPPAN